MTSIHVSGETPRVHIEAVGGDLRLRGWDRPEVAAQGDEARLSKEGEEAALLSGSGDLSARVPWQATIDLGSVGGDAKITDLGGALSIGKVGGDLALRKTGPAQVGQVGGDARVKRVAGSLRIGQAGGDVTIREVEGETSLGRVGGDLYVRDVGGACRAEQVGGDLVLSTDFMPGASYYFNVGGDVVCRVPPGASVRVRVPAEAELGLDAPGAEVVEGPEGEEIVFGAGEALLELEAGGEIRLVEEAEDYMMAINFQLEEDLESRLSELEERLSEQLSGLDALIAKKAEKFRTKAEREAERAARQAERLARKAERMAEQGRRKRSFTFSFGGDPFEGAFPRGSRRPAPPTPPREPEEPVTDEERLMILRMVEKKQISVEEAEKLLAALEGRKP